MDKISAFINQIRLIFLSKSIGFNIFALIIGGGSAYHFLVANPQKPTVPVADTKTNESQTLYVKFDRTTEEEKEQLNPTIMGIWNVSYKDNNEVLLTGETDVMCIQETSTKQYRKGCGSQAQFLSHYSFNSLYGFLIRSRNQIVAKINIPSKKIGDQNTWFEIQLNSDSKCTPSCSGSSYYTTTKDNKVEDNKMEVRNLEISSDKNAQVAQLIESARNFEKQAHPDKK